MASPLDSKYLNSPRSPNKNLSISPEKRLTFEDLKNDEQDEITALRTRISQMQSQQADRAYQYNEDCKNLELQVTNLRASVEKGEVLKQKLEYELTLAQRNLNNEKRKFSEKEYCLQKLNSNLKEKIDQLEDEVSKLQRAVQNEKEERNEDANKLKERETRNEMENSQLRQMNKTLMDSEHYLKQIQSESEKFTKELQEKCRVLQTQKESQNDTIRRLMRDVEFSSGQEERLESELSKFQERIQQYEESIEAERSSHLETKFNFELLQVRVKDMEATEASLKECRKDLENVTKDHKDLQQAMEGHIEENNELKNLIERKSHQHAMEISEMGRQLHETCRKEEKLSDQLDVHQTNFDALKSELTEAKKHQTNVESTYNSNMQELEIILNNFKFQKSNVVEKQKEASRKRKRQSSFLFEDLRCVLRDYQARLINSNSQVESLKKSNSSLTSEFTRLKQRIKEKDKSLEDTRCQLKNSHLDSARYKAECLKYENDNMQHRENSKKLTQKFADLKGKYHQLRLQMEELQETLSKTSEDHEVFLYGIYQHVITGHPSTQLRNDGHMTSFSSSELGHMIQEQLDFKLNAFKLAEEKVSKLEKSLEECHEVYDKLKHSYETNAKTNKDTEAELKLKIHELENYYKKRVHDIQRNTDKSKVTLDEVWIKLDKAKQSREGFKVENSRLKNSMVKLRNERGCLQIATALLSGSLRTNSLQLVDLSLQQGIATELITGIFFLRQQIVDLVDILRTEVGGNDENIRAESRRGRRKEPISGVLRFRCAVVVVLAANRFSLHAHYASRYLKIGKNATGFRSDYFMAVKCKDARKTQFHGLKHCLPTLRRDPSNAIEWLTNPSFVSIATYSTERLLEEIKKMPDFHAGNDDETHIDGEELSRHACDKRPIGILNFTDEIRKSCKKLIKGLNNEYPSSVYESKISMSGDSLANQIGLGLRKVLLRFQDQTRAYPYLPSSSLSKLMNSHVLAFIERLHAAEVERKTLRQDAVRLKEEREDIEHLLKSERELKNSIGREESSLRKRLDKMQRRMRDMIHSDKYDALASDLRRAMEREEKAHKQLAEYTKQLESIEKRVEKHSMQEKSQETTMTETLRMLNNAKNEIIKRDGMIKRLKHDAECCENEKNIIQRNLSDMHNAHKAIVREREIVTSYIHAVGTVLEQSRQQTTLSSSDKFDFMLPEMVLPKEILMMDGIQISTEMLACQDTVHMFYQAQSLALQEISRLCSEKEQLTRKTDKLSEEIRSQRDSVMQIRGEMNALKLASQMRKVHSLELMKVDSRKPTMNGILTNATQYPPQPLIPSPQNDFVPLLSSERS